MNNMVLLGGAIGLYLFYPLCKSILKRECAQNPLTLFLWSTLDAISAGSTYLEDGNYLLALLFCLGGLTAASCTIIAGSKPMWTRFEGLVTILVIVCIGIWVTTDNTTAAFASVVALCIASIPQINDTLEKPSDTPTLIYFGYMMSNSFATLGGKEFSIIEIGHPLSGVIICFLIFSFSLRKPKVIA